MNPSLQELQVGREWALRMVFRYPEEVVIDDFTETILQSLIEVSHKWKSVKHDLFYKSLRKVLRQSMTCYANAGVHRVLAMVMVREAHMWLITALNEVPP